MTVDADEYCRALEAHLCRRNGGHLVRVVGPAFEMVQRWFAQGIPFKVACQGIDRKLDRASAAAGRRRPVRLEFCEADVLDAFDAWRRAVGVRGAADAPPGAAGDDDAGDAKPRVSLAGHVERAIARVTGLRVEMHAQAEWAAALEQVVARLDQLVAPAKRARGDARTAIVDELARLDARLVADAARLADPAVVAEAAAEAEQDLAPFRGRLSAEDFETALGRGRARALRLRLGLPIIAFE